MGNIFIWAPLVFGLAVGWLTVYFVRQYKEYNEKNLKVTAGVFIAGTGFCSLSFFAGGHEGVICILWYLLGTGIGFFLHWIYQIIISFHLGKKLFNHRGRYSILTSCNMANEEEDSNYSLTRKAEKLNKCYNNWAKKIISDDEFVNYIQSSDISLAEYKQMKDEDATFMLLDDNIITTIEAKNWHQHFCR